MILSLLTAKGLVNAAVLAILGIVAAITLHGFAQHILVGRGEPWYVRRGTLIFLPIALLCLNVLFTMIDKLLFKTFGIGPFLSSQAAKCILIAAELMWIAFLE
jgi:hypothetical protein